MKFKIHCGSVTCPSLRYDFEADCDNFAAATELAINENWLLISSYEPLQEEFELITSEHFAGEEQCYDYEDTCEEYYSNLIINDMQYSVEIR